MYGGTNRFTVMCLFFKHVRSQITLSKRSQEEGLRLPKINDLSL